MIHLLAYISIIQQFINKWSELAENKHHLSHVYEDKGNIAQKNKVNVDMMMPDFMWYLDEKRTNEVHTRIT